MKNCYLSALAVILLTGCTKVEDLDIRFPAEEPSSLSEQLSELPPQLLGAGGAVLGTKLQNAYEVSVMKEVVRLLRIEDAKISPPYQPGPGNPEPGNSTDPLFPFKPSNSAITPPVGPVGPITPIKPIDPQNTAPPATWGDKINITAADVYTSHLYIRYKPKSEAQLLNFSSAMEVVSAELFNHPLDYDLTPAYFAAAEKEFDQRAELAAADGRNPEFEYIYTSIPADGPLPAGMDVEVIAELFMPDDIEVAIRLGLTDAVIERIVDKAMELTGNDEPEIATLSGSKKWTPSGRIMVWDDAVGGYIPLIGAKVRCYRGVKVHRGYTDSEGYFRVKENSFKKKVNYQIRWEGKMWDIRNGEWGQANYNGPKQKGEWNLFINEGAPKSLRYATIHRATWKHFNDNTWYPFLIRRNLKIKISYMHKSGGDTRGSYTDNAINGIKSEIHIYKSTIEGDRTTAQMFSTVCHELGHDSHCVDIGLSGYQSTDKILKESWAKFIQYIALKVEMVDLGLYPKYFDDKWERNIFWGYHENGLPLYKEIYTPGVNDFNLQDWGNIHNYSSEYTPLFIDLWDYYNQNDANPSKPYDEFYGFEQKELRDLLYVSRNLDQFKNNLRKYIGKNGVTENNITQYFKSYQ